MARKGEALTAEDLWRRSAAISGQDHVDAAAKLDKDEGHSGDGGGAPVTDGGERKKMRTENERRPSQVYL